MAQFTAVIRDQAAISDEIIKANSQMNELVQLVSDSVYEQIDSVDIVAHSAEQISAAIGEVSELAQKSLKSTQRCELLRCVLAPHGRYLVRITPVYGSWRLNAPIWRYNAAG